MKFIRVNRTSEKYDIEVTFQKKNINIISTTYNLYIAKKNRLQSQLDLMILQFQLSSYFQLAYFGVLKQRIHKILTHFRVKKKGCIGNNNGLNENKRIVQNYSS